MDPPVCADAALRTTGTTAIDDFAYDANGNSTTNGRQSDPATGRLTQDASFVYTYDASGRRATRTRKAGVTTGPAFTEYQYDHRGRLTRVTNKVGAAASDLPTLMVEYDYDALDRRVGRTETRYGAQGNGVVFSQHGYIYDGQQILAEIDSSGAVVRTNFWGPGTDHLLASDLGSGGTVETQWTLFDRQGTIRDLTDGTSLTASYDFTAFGELTSTLNATAAEFGVYFTGRDLDQATNLYDYRARWYDAATTQFLTPDPLGFAAGDANTYRYLGNDPANFTDLSGMEGEPLRQSLGRRDSLGNGLNGRVWDIDGRPWEVNAQDYAAWEQAVGRSAWGEFWGTLLPSFSVSQAEVEARIRDKAPLYRAKIQMYDPRPGEDRGWYPLYEMERDVRHAHQAQDFVEGLQTADAIGTLAPRVTASVDEMMNVVYSIQKKAIDAFDNGAVLARHNSPTTLDRWRDHFG